MTSKEALRILEKEGLYLSNHNTNEVLNALKKDLEVLSILKRKKYIPLGRLNPKHWLNKDVYNEAVTYKYYLLLCEEECEYFISDNEKLTKKEFNKLMKWLNND